MTCSDFEEPLGALADTHQDMRFRQALSASMPNAPQLPNGDRRPLKLDVRCFPESREEGWRQFMKVDRLHRANFNDASPIDGTRR